MKAKIPIVLVIITLVAVSSLSIALAQTSTINQATPVATTSGIASRSYIRVNGIISQWGTTPVNGLLQTQARIGTFANGNTNQLASATAMWTTNLTRPIMAVASKQNFTYTFYEARLVNASISALSASISPILYDLKGTWNIYNMTANVTIITNDSGQITSVHRTIDRTVQKASGELTVTNSWTKFTLSIVGIDSLTGSVVRSVTRQVAFNPFKVTDDITTNAITKADVAAVIHAYGSMPGWGNYEAKMDFVNHFKIDIADLSTIASNM